MNTTAPRAAFAALLLAAGIAGQDAERATHTDDASTPQVTYDQKGDGWSLRQYQLGCLSHLSYLLVSGKEAAVIDPQRDVGHYERDAAAAGAKITRVLLTHPHADFVAGHTELAHRHGAEIALSAASKAAFPHRALQDGDRVQLGAVSIEAWLTPGHTPNAMTFLVRVPGGQADPAFALTGDTLFIGSIGRPDLLDVPPAELAAQSWDSVQRLKRLPDATAVLPAHGAGSLCGAHLSPDTVSTIGREKATNPYLQIPTKASFVANILSHQPVAPQYFGFNVELNRKGPPLVERSETLPPVVDAAAAKALLADGAWIVDLRDQTAYGDAHIEGSVNVHLRGRLDTWTGIVVPVTAKLLLVGDDAEVKEGSFRLRRIGYDLVAGRLPPDAAAWRAGGLNVRATKGITPPELHALMQAGKEPVVVDVRTADEYGDLRLGDVGNIPVTEHERFAKALGTEMEVVMVCNSAYRSSLAVGLAERHGMRHVRSLEGGLDAWIAAGLPTKGRMAKGAAAAAPAAAGAAIALPEPIDAPMLQKALLDQPAAYAVLDVRAAWQFAEWSIPGSANVAPDALAAHLATLPAGRRVVLVDRDGTTAFAVAGALLAQQPERSLRVLVGGLQGYFRTAAIGGPVDANPAPAANAAAATAPATTPTKPAAAPKKRSAGC
ncbi:MAG: MBL fold metallo-hydrolase [Planctomycetota bacterium]|jgi:hydroxyacylglutathione hydrolase